MPFKEPHQMRPGNRYARERGERTLGQLFHQHMALVAICNRCKHRRVLYMPRLIERFGENYPAIELRRWLRCTHCRCRAPNLHESAR
jgi:hypothetical protein